MLATADVTLVPLGREHLARTRSWANDPELMRLLDRARVVSEPEHEAWFDAVVGRDDCAYFAIEQAGDAVSLHFPKEPSPDNELPDEVTEG